VGWGERGEVWGFVGEDYRELMECERVVLLAIRFIMHRLTLMEKNNNW
jgi:hypothetical protein